MDTTWLTDIYEKLASGFWNDFGPFLIQLIIALIVFIVGWFIAVLVGRIITEILKKVKFNQIFEAGVWKEALEKAEFKVDASGFVGTIVKWVLVIVALWISLGLLGKPFAPFAEFLENVLAYLPNVIIAAFIFVVAVIIADLLGKVIRVAVESLRVGYGHIAEVIVKWAIIIFAFLAILEQLEFTAASWIFTLIQIVLIGIVAACALAFGLGGKNVAGEILENFYRKLKG
jgi:hypothetical protein